MLRLALIFAPFAAGYYLGYLFRAINAVVAPQLSADFGLSAAGLGLVAGMVFLAIGLFQVPVGLALDRYGPRATQAALLCVAALGALLSAVATEAWTLITARFLIGAGVSGCLSAGVKAVSLWFPRERTSLLSGVLLMFGSIGAVTATYPAEWVLAGHGWRALFVIAAGAAAATAALLCVIAPAQHPRPSGLGRAGAAAAWSEIRQVYAHPAFRRIAPLCGAVVGTVWAFQTLWAAVWLSEVAGLPRPEVISGLFLMAAVQVPAAPLVGRGLDALRRRGVPADAAVAGGALVLLASELGILLLEGWPAALAWCAFAACGTMTVVNFAALTERLPSGCCGRATTALTLVHVFACFVLQYGIGAALDWIVGVAGLPLADALRLALWAIAGLQAAALAGFMRAMSKATGHDRIAMPARSA